MVHGSRRMAHGSLLVDHGSCPERSEGLGAGPGPYLGAGSWTRDSGPGLDAVFSKIALYSIRRDVLNNFYEKSNMNEKFAP